MNDQIPNLQGFRQVLWVGIGCQRGTSRQLMEMAIGRVCREHQLNESAIAGIATIDTKVSEVGLIELCRLHHWRLKTFPSEILRTVCVPNPSGIIEKAMGTPSVAEAAALSAILNLSHVKASYLDEENGAPRRQEINLILLVPKQVFRLQGEPGAVTVAIAQETELLSRNTAVFLP